MQKSRMDSCSHSRCFTHFLLPPTFNQTFRELFYYITFISELQNPCTHTHIVFNHTRPIFILRVEQKNRTFLFEKLSLQPGFSHLFLSIFVKYAGPEINAFVHILFYSIPFTWNSQLTTHKVKCVWYLENGV